MRLSSTVVKLNEQIKKPHFSGVIILIIGLLVSAVSGSNKYTRVH